MVGRLRQPSKILELRGFLKTKQNSLFERQSTCISYMHDIPLWNSLIFFKLIERFVVKDNKKTEPVFEFREQSS